MSGPISRADNHGGPCRCWRCCPHARRMKRDAEREGHRWREAIDEWWKSEIVRIERSFVMKGGKT